jgi:hypothetical protein
MEPVYSQRSVPESSVPGATVLNIVRYFFHVLVQQAEPLVGFVRIHGDFVINALIAQRHILPYSVDLDAHTAKLKLQNPLSMSRTG